VGKTPGANALAEMGYGLRVAEKVLKAHGSSLEHLRAAVEGKVLRAHRESQVSPPRRTRPPSASHRAGSGIPACLSGIGPRFLAYGPSTTPATEENRH
jgi:hypothetical protein